MTLFCVLGQTNSFGVFQELYTRSHTASASKNSWIGSFQLFLTVATGLPAGKLLDMGYFKPVFLAGSVLYVFSCFMLSLVHLDRYYQMFLCQSIGMGIGGGLLYLPAVAIQAHHWKDHRAFAIGVVFSGASAGGIAFPIMLNRLFHGSVGFAWGVRASAFLILGLLSIANLVMSPGNTAPNKVSPTTPPHQGMQRILRDMPYVLVVLGVFCINWGLFFPIFYLQLFATVHGVAYSVAFYTQAMSNASSIVGRAVCGFLADAVGPFNVFTPACLGVAVLLFGMLGIKTTPAIIAFAVLYGFCTGAYLALLAPIVASMTEDKAEIGQRIGFAFFVTAFGSLLGTPVQGALLGERFEWDRAMIFSGVMSSIGTCLVAIAGFIFSRRRTQLV
ncbi:MFS monocarboxylate transporter [Heterobasidion irregulare TC 32-1]|uniref:MFS monocarboxylate transporter n=1 Tax=Heterobasidion irregulare (strain TC 32-1) TaxID=747525 RepID=W4KFX0_HETIT|nr:MFS monocarboxylate transporter [Heterobasidion irregulare TC 32-1]ETW84742.1 MFS monocarboxylate transporter [Heterobasidion irregulare TC 32-1]